MSARRTDIRTGHTSIGVRHPVIRIGHPSSVVDIPLSGPDTENDGAGTGKRDFFVDALLVRIHSIIEMILVDRPCAMEI
jgi:hypothetical protein